MEKIAVANGYQNQGEQPARLVYNLRVITSLNQQIADQYGKLNIQSMIDWVDCDEVAVYSEDYFLRSPGVFRNLNMVEGFTKFREMCRAYPFFCGMVDEKEYNYNFDAFRFCTKGFAILDAMERNDADILVWIDADARFTGELSRDRIESMVKDQFCAVMLRKKKHLCTSFMAFNLKHPQRQAMVEVLNNMYRNAMLFALPIFQDAYMMQAILDSNQFAVNNLSEGLDLPAGPHNVFDDIFAGVAKHYKGAKKKEITETPLLSEKVKSRYHELLAHLTLIKPECILEIGTWNGNRAVQMVKASNARMYYGIDLFEDATDDTDAAELNKKPHHAVNKVSEMLLVNGVQSRLFKGDSKKVLPQALKHAEENGDKIDFIFVDGGHSIDTIWNDWVNIKGLVDAGAVAAFDDYYEDGPDTALFGANDVIKHIQGLGERYLVNFGEKADPVKNDEGGITGTTRLIFVRRNEKVNDDERHERQ